MAHPTPDDADAHGCGWPVGVTVPIGDDWRSGVYLVTLHAHGAMHDRAFGHAMFVVRAPAAERAAGIQGPAGVGHQHVQRVQQLGRSQPLHGRASGVVRSAVRTRHDRASAHRARRPQGAARPSRRSSPTSTATIYQEYRRELGYPAYIGSAGWFTYERRFVEWADANDIELDFAVSSDLEHDPPRAARVPARARRRGTTSTGRAGARDAVEAHVAGGGRLRQLLRQHDVLAGAAHRPRPFDDRPQVRRTPQRPRRGHQPRTVDERPVVRPAGRSTRVELPRCGLGIRALQPVRQATPRGSGAFTVYRHDHWLFEGTGLRYGDLLGRDDGVVGYETVGCRLGLDDFQLPVAIPFGVGGGTTPSDIEVVAFTPSSNLGHGESPASVASAADQDDLEFITSASTARRPRNLARARYGNAVMLTCRPFGSSPSASDSSPRNAPGNAPGGQVVTIGTTDWVFGLQDPTVSQVTANVLRRLSA